MWLVIDVGNSRTKAGLVRDGEFVDIAVLPSNKLLERPEYLVDWVASRPIDRVGCATVVPGVREAIRATGSSFEVDAPFFVSANSALPFKLAYNTPDTLGADRIATAVAAYLMYGKDAGRATVSVDAGTAVTYEVVSSEGVFEGGAIAPGPAIMSRGLRLCTKQLPDVQLELPDHAIGRSTAEAIQAGVMFGAIDSINGMLDRIASVHGELEVVLTGGWSETLRHHVSRGHRVDPHLALHGVRLLMKLNR